MIATNGTSHRSTTKPDQKRRPGRSGATTAEKNDLAAAIAALWQDRGPEEAERRIAEAAYFAAERRGFEPGRELEDWLEAERHLALMHVG